MRHAIWLSVAASGCLMPNLSDTLDPGPPIEEGELAFVGGLADIVVDATDREEFVALDLDALEYLEMDDPSWDLAFRRFEIDLQEGLEAAIVDGVLFDDLVTVPTEGWQTDLPDDDDDGVPEYVFEEWYDYDFDNHTLSPADRVYAVRTTAGAVIKVGFDSYYDEAGTPARIEMRIGVLEAAP